MKPTQSLPGNYHPAGVIDLSKSLRLAVVLNIAAIPLAALSGILFFHALGWLRPVESNRYLSLSISSLGEGLLFLVSVIGGAFLMIVLHEAVHGFFFWLFSHSRPVFGFRGAYAYAAAPGWYFPRGKYLWIGLSPLVVLSLAGVALMTFIPPTLFLILLYILILNFSGAIGDLLVCGWLLLKPVGTLVLDHGDSVAFFIPS